MKPLSSAILGALGAMLTLSAQAATVDLTGLGFVQYGDAQSYSLPIANYQYGFNTNNGPFAIPSTPGQISDLVVLATGSSGQPVVNNFSGMDNAYATPSGVSGSTWFSANGTTYQGTLGTVANNGANTWDSSLSALKSFLGGQQMVVFFNNNQVNSGDTSLQSLAAWSRIWITDNGGNVVSNSTFEFTNRASPYNLVTQGGGGTFLGAVTTYTAPGSGAGDPTHTNPTGAAPNGTDYVLSGGSICVVTGPALPVPVPAPCGSNPADFGGTTISSAINHNLGADHAAYALLFPELNALLNGLFSLNDSLLADYTMHVDIRLGCQDSTANWMQCGIFNGWGDSLNNGYEQIFLGTALVGQCPPTNPQCNPTIPEPGSLALAGVGLAVLAEVIRRRRQLKPLA